MSFTFTPGVRRVVEQLSNGEYDTLLSHVTSRLSAGDLDRAIQEYGRTLVSPPDETYNNLDVVPVNSAEVPTWSVWVPLWTKEEGRSDLTLEMTIMEVDSQFVIELDDLHVL